MIIILNGIHILVRKLTYNPFPAKLKVSHTLRFNYSDSNSSRFTNKDSKIAGHNRVNKSKSLYFITVLLNDNK